MFDRDFEFRGKHATYTKFLCNDAKIFRRYLDVYMAGAMVGFLHSNSVSRDTSTTDEASILASVFATERLNCEFLYRLIMLLEEKSGLGKEERVDRAFRIDDSSPEALKNNLELFHSYVYGGVEVLYEKFADCTTKDDYMEKINDMVGSFDRDTNGSTYDELISVVLIK